MLGVAPLLKFIAPHSCLACGGEGSILCWQCRPLLGVKAPICWRCNSLSAEFRTCRSCRPSSALAGVKIATNHEGYAKELIARLKFERVREAADVLAACVTPLLSAEEFDLITFVPTASRRRRQRGYDHARLLAVAVAGRLRLPLINVLGHFGSSRQVGSGRRQRLAQVRQAFYIKPTSQVQGRRVLLIDDVVTTGATLSRCAELLKEKGARIVWGAVAAKR